MAVVITGATGFLGAALRQRLTQAGQTVIALPSCREAPPAQRRQRFAAHLSQALQGGQAGTVFHLAGSGEPGLSEEQHAENNLGLAQAVLDTLRRSSFGGTLVLASSAAVYGHTGESPVGEEVTPQPCSALGRTKWQAEQLLQQGLQGRCTLRVARLFNVFGPTQRKLVVFHLARRIVTDEGPLEVFGTGQELRDFLSLQEATRALEALATLVAEETVFNVCTGHGLRISDLAQRLLRLAGRPHQEVRCLPQRGSPTAHSCIGDPRRLARAGIVLRPPDDDDFRQVLEACRTLPTAAPL